MTDFKTVIFKNMVFSLYNPFVPILGCILGQFASNGTKNVVPMMYFAKKSTFFFSYAAFSNT